jgi:hypothetical protein
MKGIPVKEVSRSNTSPASVVKIGSVRVRFATPSALGSRT